MVEPYSFEWWEKVSLIARNFAFVAGAVAAGVGLWLAWRRTRQAERQTALDGSRLAAQQEEAVARQRADAERLITDNFTRAIDQLGSEEIPVRLGGIYALERISQESARDHWPVMEVLTAYVRENAKLPDSSEPDLGTRSFQDSEGKHVVERADRPALRPDIAAILTVLGRRSEDELERDEKEGRTLDLSRTHLVGARLKGAKFRGAYLGSAHLGYADLRGADLTRAHVAGVKLKAASLLRAKLQDANLRGADLEDANVTQEVLEGAFGNERTVLP